MNSALKVRYVDRTIASAMLSEGVRNRLRNALLEDTTLYGNPPSKKPNAIGDVLANIEDDNCQKMREVAIKIRLNTERRLSNYRQYSLGIGLFSSASALISTNSVAVVCAAILCTAIYYIDRVLRSTIICASNLQNALIFSSPQESEEARQTPAA
jgi:hypothetical protein